MKPVRLLLAALSLAALAACGTESITGPGAPSARRSVTPADPAASQEGSVQSTTGGTTCDGTVVVTTDPSGNSVVTCETTTKGGGYMGSGG